MELFFAGISETNCSGFVRSILFAPHTPAGAQNELGECSHETAQRRKKNRRVNDESKERRTTVYAIYGKLLCRNAFSAIVQMNASFFAV